MIVRVAKVVRQRMLSELEERLFSARWRVGINRRRSFVSVRSLIVDLEIVAMVRFAMWRVHENRRFLSLRAFFGTAKFFFVAAAYGTLLWQTLTLTQVLDVSHSSSVRGSALVHPTRPVNPWSEKFPHISKLLPRNPVPILVRSVSLFRATDGLRSGE